MHFGGNMQRNSRTVFFVNCKPLNASITFAVIITNTIFMAVIILLMMMMMINPANGEECGQEEFAKCAEPLEMLHLTSEFSIGAAKKEELEKLCQELRKGVRCIQSYTRRCMDLQQRNQFNKLYHGINQFIRDLCNAGDFQDEYLRHAPCSENAKEEFEICAKRYKETMVFLKPNNNKNYESHETHENITLNENIKTICCSINELVDCSERAARKICGLEAAKFTRQLVNKYANSLTEIYCDDFAQHVANNCHSGQSQTIGNTNKSLPLLLLCQIGLILSIIIFHRHRHHHHHHHYYYYYYYQHHNYVLSSILPTGFIATMA